MKNVWLYVSVLVIGAMMGVLFMWLMASRKVVTASQAPAVIVVKQEVASPSQVQGKMPIFPEKGPQYPLRNNSHIDDFQQIGLLKSVDGTEPIALPLFGKRMANRPDRWEYYTATDKQNMLKVPIMVENRDCSEEVGCNEVYKGDRVMVPVYDKMFEVQLYKYAS